MKNSIFILMLLALSMTAIAQQKKVAVYVTGQQSGITKVLGDQLVSSFANDGKYIAIERTASFLSELSKEQGYQRTGAVDDNELSRLGKQFGVQLVCVAEIIEVFGENYVSARLIDVETAEILNTSNINSALSNMSEMKSVCSKLAKDLTQETVQEKAAKEAERQRKAAEEQAKRAKENKETKEMLETALINGYVRIGDLWVTTSHPYCDKQEALEVVQSAKFGGISGWRIPTLSELITVKYALENWYKARIGLDLPRTWSSDHSYNDYSYRGFWDTIKIGDSRYKKYNGYVILVHD